MCVRRKADKNSELINSSVVRFLVLPGEVGGRWSQTALDLLRSLAWARAESLAPPRLWCATAEALVARWWNLVAVATQD